MTTIGTVSIAGGGPVLDGQAVTLTALFSGDAAAPVYAWSLPPGSTAPVAVTPALTWTFNAGTDEGLYTCTVTDGGASDTPKEGTASLSAAVVISRFGRQYVAFDPDGSGAGPSTWVLASSGALLSPLLADARAAIYSASAGIQTRVGMPLAMEASGQLVPARATTYALASVVGFALTAVQPGQTVSYSADGAVTSADWTAVAGVAGLTPGALYFLSAADPGKLTTTSPSTGGQFSIAVGRATSTSRLEVEIHFPVMV